MFKIGLNQPDRQRSHILPMVHIMLVFIWCVAPISEAMDQLEHSVPWVSICFYLNHLAAQPNAWTDAIY